MALALFKTGAEASDCTASVAPSPCARPWRLAVANTEAPPRGAFTMVRPRREHRNTHTVNIAVSRMEPLSFPRHRGRWRAALYARSLDYDAACLPAPKERRAVLSPDASGSASGRGAVAESRFRRRTAADNQVTVCPGSNGARDDRDVLYSLRRNLYRSSTGARQTAAARQREGESARSTELFRTVTVLYSVSSMACRRLARCRPFGKSSSCAVRTHSRLSDGRKCTLTDNTLMLAFGSPVALPEPRRTISTEGCGAVGSARLLLFPERLPRGEVGNQNGAHNGKEYLRSYTLTERTLPAFLPDGNASVSA